MSNDDEYSDGTERQTVEVAQEVAEIKGSSVSQDILCVDDHPSEGVAIMCVSGGGNDVLEMLAERGIRVGELTSRKCEKINHDHRVYIEPIENQPLQTDTDRSEDTNE